MKVQMQVVQGKAPGQLLGFPCGEFIFGRGPECHVRPNSDWISRQHCLLRITDNEVHLRDLGSANGTLVNGVRVVGQRKLESGDLIELGPFVLKLILSDIKRDADTVLGDRDTDQVVI